METSLNAGERRYVVAVRALCEFAAKVGDLDHRFTPAPSAAEGIAGHAVVASRRGPESESEVPLSGDHGPLHVRGRADGYDPPRRRVEEVKTYRGDLAAMPANHRALHWAQAKVYGALLCRERHLDAITVALVYFDIGDQTDTTMSEKHTAAALELFFTTLCDRFVAWAEQEMAHRAARDAALATLAFPHGTFRPGQRELAEGVYRAAAAGTCLAAQAPTGIGKTLGTLYPMLKACGPKQIDKVFFLAAKGPGRGLALEGLATVTRGGMPLRVLELVARDKACEYPGQPCQADACPLARGFYDRLPAARQAAADAKFLDRARLRAVAAQHHVCPYYLSQEMARWADVVVGDYNYFFDGTAMLHGLTLANQWRVGLLVDEAHNLLDRARSMYSASLERAQLQALLRKPPAALAPSLTRLLAAWRQVDTEVPAPFGVADELPQRFFGALSSCVSAVGNHLGDFPGDGGPELLRFYFDTLAFSRVAERFGAHSQFDVSQSGISQSDASQDGADSVLCLRNIVPAPFLKQRFAAAHTATLFSATFAPRAFQSDMLGLPDTTRWLDVGSPFSPSQLAVHVSPHISTRYADRAASAPPIAELIAAQYVERPGNYLAFFSSFDYLQQVLSQLQALHPDVPVFAQSRAMGEAARSDFLARFTPDGRGVGFAVLGGAFAEGIDLPGDRLIGAFIATLGLPQVNPVNECFRARLDTMFGAGHAYAYLYPGLQKVVQAAGRVIRTLDDQGVVHLIDDRYTRGDVRALLPGWWPPAQRVPVPRRLPTERIPG